MTSLTTLAALQTAKPPGLWAFGIGSAAGLLAIALVVLFLMRRYFRNARNAHKEETSQTPGTKNPPAFMAPPMKGGIQKPPDQKKELERLHKKKKKGQPQTDRP